MLALLILHHYTKNAVIASAISALVMTAFFYTLPFINSQNSRKNANGLKSFKLKQRILDKVNIKMGVCTISGFIK